MPEKHGDAPRPGLVFVHGGGWRGGDKRRGYFLQGALDYAQKGYVCISVNYRLTGEAPFPACVEDVKCAVRWFRAHAKEYNVDPKRIGGYGNSAGAHLVSMLGLVGPKAGLEGDGPYRDQSSMLNAVCAAATPTDFLNWGRRPANSRGVLRGGLLAGPAETLRERAKKASPITYVNAEAPPFLIVHGTKDGTVNVSQGDSFVKALREAGAKDVTYLRYEGEGHGVFGARRDDTYPAMERFFARTLGGTAREKPSETDDSGR
jgi:acetyl esterase/lipase